MWLLPLLLLLLPVAAGDPALSEADLRSPIRPPVLLLLLLPLLPLLFPPFAPKEPFVATEALVVVVVEGGVVDVNLLIEKLLLFILCCFDADGLPGLVTEAKDDGTKGNGGSGPPANGGK